MSPFMTKEERLREQHVRADIVKKQVLDKYNVPNQDAATLRALALLQNSSQMLEGEVESGPLSPPAMKSGGLLPDPYARS